MASRKQTYIQLLLVGRNKSCAKWREIWISSTIPTVWILDTAILWLLYFFRFELQVQRFQCLISLMLSSQTRDEVNFAAMQRLRVNISNHLNTKQVEWWSENQTNNVCFMVQNVRNSNGPPNHVIRPFDNQTKKCPKSQMLGFQVFDVQMVTVFSITS